MYPFFLMCPQFICIFQSSCPEPPGDDLKVTGKFFDGVRRKKSNFSQIYRIIGKKFFYIFRKKEKIMEAAGAVPGSQAKIEGQRNDRIQLLITVDFHGVICRTAFCKVPGLDQTDIMIVGSSVISHDSCRHDRTWFCLIFQSVENAERRAGCIIHSQITVFLTEKAVGCFVYGSRRTVRKKLWIHYRISIIQQDVDDIGEYIRVSFQEFIHCVGTGFPAVFLLAGVCWGHFSTPFLLRHIPLNF